MICHLIVGPDGHGVTESARSLAAHSAGSVLVGMGPLPPGPVHVTFTDHLFGATPERAVDAVLARCAGQPLSVSLHDIPQEAEGAARFARRAPAYRRLVSAADLAVVGPPACVVAVPVVSEAALATAIERLEAYLRVVSA